MAKSNWWFFDWCWDIAPPLAKCTICGEWHDTTKKYDYMINPFAFCNIAIFLPCGHIMLDDCGDIDGKNDLGMNGACMYSLDGISIFTKKHGKKIVSDILQKGGYYNF